MMRSFAERPICLPSGRVASFVAGLCLPLVVLGGCASPGAPRAPSLRLPEPVSDLRAERRGDTVILRFVTPLRTTDDDPITSPVTASLCRAVEAGLCKGTASFSGNTAIAGQVEWKDALPSELASGPARRLTYEVEVFNVSGKSAGRSRMAFALAGAAPNAVDGLRADGSHRGILLRWTPEAQFTGEVLVKRETVMAVGASAAPGAAKKAAVGAREPGNRKTQVGAGKFGGALGQTSASKDDSEVWLHAAEGKGETDRGGIVDSSAHVGEPYRYTAVRRKTVTIDGHKLELGSERSAPVTTTLEDIYPPAIPQKLLAVGFPSGNGLAVDLVWQPDLENDVTGYNVYRKVLGSDSAVVKVNETPVALPAFHDAAAARNVGYRYTVTAVGGKGNESAVSEPADVAAIP